MVHVSDPVMKGKAVEVEVAMASPVVKLEVEDPVEEEYGSLNKRSKPSSSFQKVVHSLILSLFWFSLQLELSSFGEEEEKNEEFSSVWLLPPSPSHLLSVNFLIIEGKWN